MSGGVWERSEGRRWEVVGREEQRLPGRRAEAGPVDPGLSIQAYLAGFVPEAEAGPGPGSSLVYQGEGPSVARLEAPPAPRRVKKKRRRGGGQEGPASGTEEAGGPSSDREAGPGPSTEGEAGPSTEPQPSTSRAADPRPSSPETPPASRRRRAARGWWKRKKGERRRRNRGAGPRGGPGRGLAPSVESSPGRGSPSPASLSRILRGAGGLSPDYGPPSPADPAKPL
jgi:hypothetical protein